MMRLATNLLTALLLTAVTPAMAQGTASHAGMAMGGNSAINSSMMDAMTKMNQAMSSAPMTGNPEHDFVAMMIPHHQGAIDMAKFELQHGKDPELRKLAQAIVAAQDKEIAVMQRWLAKHPAK